MQPKILLRIAAVAITIFDLGHTVGGMILAQSHGPEEDSLLASLAGYHFEIMGSTRSHRDFYRGEGWYLSAMLTTFIVLCWQLSNAASANSRLVGNISLVLAVFFAISVALCATFFFVAPLVMSAVACVALAAAGLQLRAGQSI